MDRKISRNAPCPCGSGKKYKKCCGANEVISITQVLESEIDQLETEIIQFAIRNYGNEIEDSFEDFQSEFIINENELKFYEVVHVIWFTLFEYVDSGKTALEKFIEFDLRKIKRPKLKQIVQTWTEARTLAGEIISSENNEFVVKDILSGELLEVTSVSNIQQEYEDGTFFVSFLLPFDDKYIFYPAPFDLPGIQPEDAVRFIESTGLKVGYDDPQEFLTDFFLEVVYDLPSIGINVDIEELEWSEPVYLEVAAILKDRLEALGESREVIETGILLWNRFCHLKQKRIQNPKLYAAALHYLLSSFGELENTFTQKELGEQYDVSAGSISSASRDLDQVLSEDAAELGTMNNQANGADVLQLNPQLQPMATERVLKETMDELQEQNFDSIEDINKFLNKKLSSPKKESKNKKPDGQQMLYDAFETEGPERYRLAEQALELNPNLPDAYNILAEDAASLREASLLYEKGMWLGQKELGKSFFKENKGHFWGLIETRPFMRSKLNYANSIFDLGKIEDSITQYEELLDLNPNDNQGVRFQLFIAYVTKGDLRKAHELLDRYDEETTDTLYNKLLLEILELGFTAKATQMLKQAKKSNKFVIPYLTGKKRLPSPVPDYYGFGDENEAVIYADAHLELWKKIRGFQDWFKGK